MVDYRLLLLCSWRLGDVKSETNRTFVDVHVALVRGSVRLTTAGVWLLAIAHSPSLPSGQFLHNGLLSKIVLFHPRAPSGLLRREFVTPFFQDVNVECVRVMLIIGPTGTGKSVHGNNLVALEQKYGGFTYIFDIGRSYESVVELYGGRVDRVGKDGPRVNPFALEPIESNIKFLYSFVKLLLTNGGASLEPEDDDVVRKAVKDPLPWLRD
jgi:TraG P-loop domain